MVTDLAWVQPREGREKPSLGSGQGYLRLCRLGLGCWGERRNPELRVGGTAGLR